jgi:hypothetical protein
MTDPLEAGLFSGSKITIALPDRVIEVADANVGAKELQQVAITLLMSTYAQFSVKKPSAAHDEDPEDGNGDAITPGGYA